jgi:hypothetical protein
MVNHLNGSFFSHEAAKKIAASVLGFLVLVLLVLDDTVPNVRHNPLK